MSMRLQQGNNRILPRSSLVGMIVKQRHIAKASSNKERSNGNHICMYTQPLKQQDYISAHHRCQGCLCDQHAHSWLNMVAT